VQHQFPTQPDEPPTGMSQLSICFGHKAQESTISILPESLPGCFGPPNPAIGNLGPSSWQFTMFIQMKVIPKPPIPVQKQVFTWIARVHLHFQTLGTSPPGLGHPILELEYYFWQSFSIRDP